MFRTVRNRLWEARVADLKDAHEREVKQLMRLVDALAEQIEYLRAQMGRPNMARELGLNPSKQPVVMEGSMPYLSEEEEDLLALKEYGHLDERALEEALAQAGLRNPEVTRS